jgi:aryl-alcohol dehydrogenase-like predicted oxidoreductase
MRYVRFGQTGIKVSEICLGTMTFGNEADEDLSRRIMDRAFEAGVNFFDTADIYTRGTTEQIVGRWLKERREAIVLATKVHFPTGKGVNERGSSRLHILRGVEASLKRLQTDHIDVLYLHHWDEETPLAESLGAMDHLVRQGKVHYVAVSNFSAWQTVKAIECAKSNDFAPVCALQPMYSLVKRVAEVEILPMAAHEGIAVCPYNALAAGLLTGKYNRGETGRITVHPMYAERYKDPSYLETAAKFCAYAKKCGVTPAALAVAWVVSHRAVTSALVGARNVEQLEQALASQDISLTPDEREEISALSPAPPLPTDREPPVAMHIPKEAEHRGATGR